MSEERRGQVQDRIDYRVLATGIFFTVMEYEVFTFSKSVVETAGRDAWISIVIGGLILMANVFFLCRLAQRFPQQTFFEYCGTVWGKGLGIGIKVLYLLYWIAFLLLLVEEFAVVNKMFFLPDTPSLVPKICILIGAVWLGSYGLVAILRFFQVVGLFVLIPILLLLFLALPEIHLSNFRPILGDGAVPVLRGALWYLATFQGLEIILFIMPFLVKPKKILKPSIAGLGGLVGLSLFLSVCAIGILGKENVNSSIWPGIATVSTIQLPGFPVERFELFLTIIWIIAIFATICMILYLFVHGIGWLFHRKPTRHIFSIVAAVLLLLLEVVSLNYTQILCIRTTLTRVTAVFTLVIPLLTWIVAIIRRKEGAC